MSLLRKLRPLSRPSRGYAGRAEKVSAGKLHATQYVVMLALVVLAAGMWRLQVLGVDNYRVLAEENRIRKEPIPAPRGKIFDRDGRLLVDNYPSVSCYLVRQQARDLDSDIPLIARGLDIPVDQVQATLRRFASEPRYERIPLKDDITPDEQAFIEAHRNELPELETVDEPRRLYPLNGFAAHLIGYVGEVSEADLESGRYDFYEPGDMVGKSGVEATYDRWLRGVDGYREVVVNSHGKEVGQLGEQLAIPGHDLRLTIDLDLQKVAEKAMEGKIGGVVAMDPHTGEILAMVSRPTFDPNQFAGRLTRSYWSQIVNDPNHPLLNKAIQAQLAPGSTFKIIMSLAGLQENVAQDMHVMCNGGGTFFGHFFACDKHHGMVDIDHAIPWSCDTFYYTLAEKLGIDTIAKYAKEVGLSQKTGIDLPDEADGTMPSTEWKLRTQHEKWYAGEVISVGIGQGAIQVTPVQLARALSGIASGGSLVRPHVVMPGEVSPQIAATVLENHPGSGNRTIPITPANWETITDAMAQTMLTGTASAAHLEGIDFAGKTGTAQVVSHSAGATSLGVGAERANAWFVGMAPRRNPDIVVAVLVEHGGWGADAAAPVAAQIVDAFVNNQRRKAGNLRIETVSAPAPQHQSGPAAQPTAATKPVSEPSAKPVQAAATAPPPARPASARAISAAQPARPVALASTQTGRPAVPLR
ncbi:MAG TPA: penicillin-binding protein 2 [Acidobacteriaceae bacterium]|nr:penicillin-binding protein 2 [Acidobacteriaceae bacterium]